MLSFNILSSCINRPFKCFSAAFQVPSGYLQNYLHIFRFQLICSFSFYLFIYLISIRSQWQHLESFVESCRIFSLWQYNLQRWQAGLDAPRVNGILVSSIMELNLINSKANLQPLTTREVPTPIHFSFILEIPTSVKNLEDRGRDNNQRP